MECLIENEGVATQEQLIDAIWGDDEDGGPLCVEDILRQHIHCLRKHLRDGWDVVNVFNHSYRLAPYMDREQNDTRAYVDQANDLRFEGERYHLTPSQALIMRLLLTGRPISVTEIGNLLWPNEADYDAHSSPEKTIHVHIHQMRKAQPLAIRNINCVGYILEFPEMTDKPRPPEVDQALGRVKADMEEGGLRDLDLKPGPRTYEGNTGKIKGENEKIEVEIIVRPKSD